MGTAPTAAQTNPYSRAQGEELELLIWDGGAASSDNMMASVQQKWTSVGGGTLKFHAGFRWRSRSRGALRQPGRPRPGCFLANAPNVITYQKLSLIEPVTDMFSKDDLEDFFPTVELRQRDRRRILRPSTNAGTAGSVLTASSPTTTGANTQTL